jgi:glycosyltransferase involved in cell wall biosynthesis
VDKIRVLHILEELKPSGAEVMLRAAAPYWRDRGFESHILSVGSSLGAYASVLETTGYHIHYMKCVPSFAFLRRVFTFLHKERYDAVHIHLERANFWYALLARLAGTTRVAYTIHGIFFFRGMLRLERRTQRWLMRSLLGVKMVSGSRSGERSERVTFGNNTRVILNWFDSSKFRPPSTSERGAARKMLGVADDVIIITSVGGCDARKNHAAIIKAIGCLPKNIRLRYLHVGPEVEGRPERKLSESTGVSDRVEFLGIVLDILPILYASDVFVMPSLYEGLSIAAVEAMGTGLPAILSNVEGLRDFRDAGDGVCWVEPTPESVAKGIRQVLEISASERRQMGSKLSSYAHKHFGVENGAAAYAAIYTE